jgi:CDP-glucose 4,6-dehydratase
VEVRKGTVESMGLTDFWKGRRVFLTGHTGFKGSWLCLWLEALGADVHGYALPPEGHPNLHEFFWPAPSDRQVTGDIRNAQQLQAAMARAQPEIVIHMAAQALVRRSYTEPVATFDTNIMGTVHLLEAAKAIASVKTILVVTSDKVYANDGAGRAFIEQDRLGGKDPYSSSKAAAELICNSYRASYFDARDIRIGTARAGNVIGGGDWSDDRLVPDFIRALEAGRPLLLRYPDATRPWQHVLESLAGYLAYAEALHEKVGGLPEALNFGPDPKNVASVARIAEALGAAHGLDRSWDRAAGEHPPEAPALTLDASLAAQALAWRPRLDLAHTLEWTAAWYKAHREGADMRAFSLGQISAYEATVHEHA